MHIEFNNPEITAAIQDLMQETFVTTWIVWRFWMLAIELRMCMSWFLNINPYFYPVYYIWIMTDPCFNFGRNVYPKIIGFDSCFIVNFAIVCKVELLLDYLAFGMNKHNQEKITGKPWKKSAVYVPPPEAKSEIPHSSSEGLVAISDGSNLEGVTNFELAHNESSYSLFHVDFLHFPHF